MRMQCNIAALNAPRKFHRGAFFLCAMQQKRFKKYTKNNRKFFLFICFIYLFIHLFIYLFFYVA